MPSLNPGEGPRLISHGSFAFDEDTMRRLITDWTELAKSYRSSRGPARAMAQVEGPGTDHASQSHAAAANRSGQSYLDYLRHNEQYCDQQAQLFQDALDDYLAAEDANVAAINKAGADDT